jgi:hypothetical protein
MVQRTQPRDRWPGQKRIWPICQAIFGLSDSTHIAAHGRFRVTRTKYWQHWLDRIGKGMALTGAVGIVALAASLTATTVLAWNPTDYSVLTASFTTSGPSGSASQQAAPGQFIYDTATLTSSFEYIQSGSLDFYLYQGTVPGSCRYFNYSGSGSIASYVVPVLNTSTGPTSGALTESLSSLNTSPTNTGFQVPANAQNGSSYYWVAVYNDGQESLEQNSACNSEPVTVAVPLPALGVTTQATPSSAIAGSLVSDGATVSNYTTLLATDSLATGIVNFYLYQSNTCTGTPVYSSGAETLTAAGTASTPANAFMAIAAGPYEWQAQVTISTGTGWPSLQPFWSTCLDEPLSVQATTGLTTAVSAVPSLSGTWAHYGASVADTATVTNGYQPTGSVVFNLFNNVDCAGTPVYTSGSVTLSSGHATSAAYVVNESGTWEWTATYLGDTYNTGSTSACGSEPVTVGKATPPITTVTSNGTKKVPVGTEINDTANITNATNGTLNSASGNVEFDLYQQGTNKVLDCSGGSVFSDEQGLSVGQPYSTATSTGYRVTNLGDFGWTVRYNGDSNDSSDTSHCGSEMVDVVQAAPTITTINNRHAVEGSSLTDEAEITGGYDATNGGAHVTFGLYANDINGTCSGPVGSTSTGWVDASGDAFSHSVVVSQPGEYYWMDTYSGNADNQTVSSSCNDEPVWVSNFCPKVHTVQQASIVTSANTSVSDTAVLSNFYPNPYDPSGYNGGVEFELFGPVAANDPIQCQWGAGGNMVFSSSWELVQATGGQYQATLTANVGNALLPGDYFWEAQYSDPGAPFDNTASAGCGEETVVTPNTATLLTLPSPGGTIGVTLTDAATVTSAVEAAGDPATDTLSFELVSMCPSTVGAAPLANTVVSDFGAITATASYDSATGTYTYYASVPSSGYQSTRAGTFYWNVSFSGDGYNLPVTNQCGEPVAITGIPVGGQLAASTPITGADLFGPGLAGALAMLFGGLLLVVGRRVFRVRPN